MKKKLSLILLLVAPVLFMSLGKSTANSTCSITVIVNNLRNSKGYVQFSLYNKDGSIPDEDYENYYKQKKVSITNGTATVTFTNIPKGRYAVNILHDENKNGKIDKGWIMPIEGIGFSNYSSIGFTNRPNFSDASFYVKSNTTKQVKVIYM